MTDASPVQAGTPLTEQRALRVLSIAPTSFFGDYGCHVRILEEARALKALGYDITLLTYFKGDNVPGFRIIRTAPTPWHGNYEVGSSRHKYAYDLLLAIRLGRVLMRNQYDVIHAHLHEGALIGSWISLPWRTPVCFDYQGSLTSEMLHHGFLRKDTRALSFWQKLEHYIETMPAAIVTSTQNASESLRRILPQKKLVRAVQDGVNTDIFRPDVLSAAERSARRAAFGLRSDETVVVYLGLLAKHQGIECIIQAAARLKQQGLQVRWLIMGYPGIADWQQKSVEYGVDKEMIFTGRVPYNNAPHMLRLGDIAIAPKLSLTEGSGKILNYMAMALPTVAFDTPAQVEYLGNLGIYAPVGDVAVLAQQIAELVGHPDYGYQLGQSCRVRAHQQFGWDRVGRQLDDVYRHLCIQNPRITLQVRSRSTTTTQ